MRKIVLLVVLCVFLAGCGELDWFPEKVQTPTTPTTFSFVNKTDVAPGGTVSSDPVTIAGISSGSAPISVTGDAGSKYRINSGDFTSSPGTVNNNDVVTVQHTAASSAGVAAKTSFTVGDFTAVFTSTTALFGELVFPSKTVGTNQTAFSDPVPFIGKAGVTFQIAIQNGEYAIAASDYTGDCASLNNYTASVGSITDGQKVCIKNTAGITSTTTTVLINNTVDGTFTSSP